MRKWRAGALALTLAMSMSANVFAAEGGSATNTGTSTGENIDNPTSINIDGLYTPAIGGEKKISVDIAWEAMDFTYNEGNKGVWNAGTHSYNNGSTGAWSTNQSAIIVKNHSNVGITASFAFAGENGVKGVFTKETLDLASADADAYRATEEGTTPAAPTGQTRFGIDPKSPAITASGELGKITVTIRKQTPSINGQLVGDEGMKEAVKTLLDNGTTDLNIKMPASASTDMYMELREALNETTAADGTINMTISGAEEIPYCNLGTENGIFSDITKLKSVSLPDTKVIGQYAFADCSNMTAVSAPAVETVKVGAFKCCGFTSLELPKAKTLEEDAFSLCIMMESANLPEVETIGAYAFYQTIALETFSAPKVHTIGLQAFCGASFTTCEFPKATSVGNGVFLRTKLTTVKLPALTVIARELFDEATNLTSIELGSVVTSVGANWLSEPEKKRSENIVLTINANQGDVGENPTVIGVGGTFGGYTFKEVKKALSE